MEKTKPSTKIICTIGPASSSLEMIQNLFLSGMSIVRLNMSHGTRASQAKIIENVRIVEKKYNTRIFIALDTRGPESRIFCGHPVDVKEGDIFKIWTNTKNKAHPVTTNIHSFKGIVEGSLAVVDDSKLNMRIDKVEDDCITVTSLGSHILKNEKRIHFKMNRNSSERSFVSDLDREDLKFANEYKLDAIFVSFVESLDDLIEIKKFIDDPTVQVISKIESKKGFENLSRIEECSDGIMVARGDLMNDVGFESLFSYQKKITGNTKKPVIMATEMLQSMSNSKVPFRAEISDIGNAVLDGCSAVMLSSETATGMYPDEAVDTMRQICIDAERLYFNDQLVKTVYYLKGIEESREYMFQRGIYCKVAEE